MEQNLTAEPLCRAKLAIIVNVRFLLFFRGCVVKLRRNGLDVTAISPPGAEQELIRAEGALTCTIPIYREMSPLHDLLSLWRLWRTLKNIRPHITNSETPKTGLLGGLAAVLAGVPCRIYTLNGLRLETTSGLKRWVLTWAEKISCKCAHRVICVSPSLQKRAIGMKLVEEGKTRVLTCHGLDTDKYARVPDNLTRAEVLRKEFNLPKEQFVMGFVGRFTRDKGIPELLEAYYALRNDFPEMRLLMVGDFEDGDPVPQDVRTRIESDPLIVRPGFVADTSAYYHLMDVLVTPTWREGFGHVNIEAQAAGIPVVSTLATGAIDSVQNGKTGLQVPVGDVPALTCAIRRLLGDASMRYEMGRNGQQWVASKFAQDIILAELIQEYNNLLFERLGSCLTTETA